VIQFIIITIFTYPSPLSSMADQNNRKPEIFELNNGTMQLLVANLGCTITSFSVPGKDGSLSLSLSIFKFSFYFFWHCNELMMFCNRCVIRCCSWPWLCWILSGMIWSKKKKTFCDWICFCHWWLCFLFQNFTFFLAFNIDTRN